MKQFLTLAFCLLAFSLHSSPIAFYGDTRSNHEIHRAIIQAIASHQPKLAFHTGDLVSRGLNQTEYDLWFEISAPLLEQAPIYPARGNHERSPELFLAQFPALGPKTYYEVIEDSLRFVILDSNLDLYPGSEQYNWLLQRLEAGSALASIVILHHPIFSTGYHADELGLQTYLPSTLRGKGVATVISGHNHSYERSSFEDLTYLVSGGGGAPIREARHTNRYSQVYHNTHHFILMQRQGRDLQFQVIDLEGRLLDSFDIKLPDQH